MKTLFKNFLLMIQFMTRIKINLSLPCERADFKRGLVFLPIVGGIVGLFQYIVFNLCVKFLPINISAIFTVLAGILITGAFHMDGLGDTCDGFFSFRSKEDIISIMKDSRIGTFACTAIIIDILLKTASISNLNGLKMSLVIIAAPMISKSVIVTLAFIGRPAKEKGIGNLFIGNSSLFEVIIVFCYSGIAVVLLCGVLKGIMMLVLNAAFALVFNRYCNSKINGITGDTLGAANEISEIMNLVIFIGMVGV